MKLTKENNMEYVLVIVTIAAIVVAILNIALVQENKELVKALEEAQANDARDPETGRYTGKK